jgi:hypothetical protein
MPAIAYAGENAMNENQARAVAAVFGGDVWNSGGGIWLVIITRSDGRVVVMSDELITEYASGEAHDDGDAPTNSISLVGPASFIDERGHMYILGLPVEPDMLTIADLIGEDGED